MKTRAFMGGWLAGWLAGLLGWLGWLGWLVGWLVGSPGKGREGRSKAFLYAEGIGAYVAFSAFSRWSFSFSMPPRSKYRLHFQLRGLPAPTRHFTPRHFPLLSPPQTVSPSPHFLSRLLFFSCISCSPLSLSLYFFFLSFLSFFFFLHWFKHRKKRGC